MTADRIHKIDPTSGTVVASIPAPGGGKDSGLAWAEGTLWVGQYRDRKIHQIDPETGRILSTIESDRFVTGVTFCDGELWHGSMEDDRSELRRIDKKSGDVLEALEMPAGTMVSGSRPAVATSSCVGGGNSGKVRVVRRPKRRRTELIQAFSAGISRPARWATSVTSSYGATGFSRCFWKPVLCTFFRCSSVVYAVTASDGSRPARILGEQSHTPDQLVAVFSGHGEVADQDIGHVRLEGEHGISDRRRRSHVRAVAFEEAHERVTSVCLVVDDEDLRPRECARGGMGRGGIVGGSWSRLAGKSEVGRSDSGRWLARSPSAAISNAGIGRTTVNVEP